MKVWTTLRLFLALQFGICAFMLQGCATAQGELFSKPLSPMSGKTRIYLYRTSGIFAFAEAFRVYVDGKEIGGLPNASFLSLQLSPGLHTLKVAPGGLALSSSLDVAAQAGTTAYYQYDFINSILGNIHFIGSSIEPRTADVALADMKDLKAALPRESLDLDFPGLHALVDDVGAVPGLNERGRSGYQHWLRQQKPRAFVLGTNGAWNSAWGLGTSNPMDPKDPTERALHHCEQRGRGPCKVYAVDDTVVWQEPAR
jgi:hypothetical protein